MGHGDWWWHQHQAEVSVRLFTLRTQGERFTLKAWGEGSKPNRKSHWLSVFQGIQSWLLTPHSHPPPSTLSLSEICGALFIDFAKAFDVISHNLLLKKMNLYGLTTDRSFLSDHHQVVSVKNKQSEVKPVVFGVPWGSVLGPLLFSIYITDLPLHISSGRCDMLTDDNNPHFWERCPLNSCYTPVMHFGHYWMDPYQSYVS